MIVEAATRSSYEEQPRRQVSRPLGLDRTSLPRGPALAGPYLHGYEIEGDDPPEDVSEPFAGGWSWVFRALRAAEEDAVCAAVAGGR